MEKIIEKIIQKKKHVYFISPSFGDVAAYAGDLLSYLNGKVEITVVNVFTSGGDGRTTLSAKQYLASFDIPTAQRLYEVLDNSDAAALQPFQVKRINLGFEDALWRRRKHKTMITQLLGERFVEAESLYPLFATHILSGKLAREDRATEHRLIDALKRAVQQPEESVIFCPLGYGKHVDYLLVRNVCSKAFEKNLFYCADISTVLQFTDREQFIVEQNLHPMLYESEQSEMKRKILKSYKQFENKEEEYLHPEIYYAKADNREQSTKLHDKIQHLQERYTVKQFKELSSEFLHEWDELWKSSVYKHYFNSPFWFEASKKAFAVDAFVLLAIYDKKNLVGVLPLVKEKKYGISTYVLPGGRYFDRSPLLLKTVDAALLQTLFSAAKEVGSFYMSEIDRFVLDTVVPHASHLSAAETSISPFWKLPPDAYRFLAWRDKKTLLKKLAEEEGNFELRVFTTESKKHLQTLMEIEKESSKGQEYKDTFSDKSLHVLYKQLEALAPGSLWFIILYYKNEPICYNYGFSYDDVYACCGTSFKLQYRQFAPGLLLTYLALPKLEEMGIRLFDFSRGISRYKRDFTPYSYQQYGIAYGSNVFNRIWLRTWDTIRVWLEHHPEWYERVRVMKNKFLRIS